MSAHDQLERQLLDSVARLRDSRSRRGAHPVRWSRVRSVITVAVSSVTALGVAVFAIVSLGHHHIASRTPTPSGHLGVQRRGGCNSNVRRGVLPVWARAGFGPPTQRVPHVLGTSGSITAILFAYPLLSPPPHDHNNKILWVSRVATKPSSDLLIAAQRMNGTRRVGSPVGRRVPGGPGPSLINLPSPGCWRLTLRWSGHVDRLDLQYATNRSR